MAKNKSISPLDFEVHNPSNRQQDWFTKLGDPKAQQFVLEAFQCYQRGELKYNVTSQVRFYEWLKAALSEHFPDCPFPSSYKTISDWIRAKNREGASNG